jgi:hypothetical protein
VYIRNDPGFKDLRGLTFGVIFLGTPHSGSGSASLGDIFVKIAKVAWQASASQLIKDLKTNSRQLEELSHNFKPLHSELQLISFYEQLQMKKLRVVSCPL